FKEEQILHGDDFAFHAGDFGDMRDFARTVAQALYLYDDVDRGCDLLAHGFGRQVETAHGDHVFHTAQGLARIVGVDRAHRAVVARVHGLQQVEGFGTAHLANDDAVWAHTQTVLDEIAH